jgi:hypothetical protein
MQKQPILPKEENILMKYVLLMYADESKVPQTREAQKDAEPVWAALVEEMNGAGVWLSSSGLSSITDATTVRIRQGKTLFTDGPFAETHEQLGGFFLLECQDLDEALRWAGKVPTAKYGSVEVRPLWTPS